MQAFASGTRKIVLLAAATLAGCGSVSRVHRAHHPWPLMASDMARVQREADMNGRWENRSFGELLATFGPPKMLMNIPGGGNPPSFVVVYGLDPKSGCIDAFAVHAGEQPFVRVYHCR